MDGISLSFEQALTVLEKGVSVRERSRTRMTTSINDTGRR